MSGGQGHEHISDIKWRNDANGDTGQSTREAMVKFVDENGNTSVYCGDGAGNSAWVHVASNGSTRYIRTVSDGKWTNNLLALPLF